MLHTLHFTIGPVQGFVAEARRTRDLWSGSLLLSWLSARAMLAAENAGGAIVFPDVAYDDLIAAVRAKAKGQPPAITPHIGSLPNRFKASVPGTFDPAVCKTAVLDAWAQLAEAVWDEFIAGIASHGNPTPGSTPKAIWDRQIANFWDIAWVMDKTPADRSDGAWLDQRKNWRSHYPAYISQPNPATPGITPPRYEEGGDHCQLMGFFQELSGFVRAKGEKKRQDDFWSALQDTQPKSGGSRIGELNLRTNERLCAVALVKRLFPLLPEATLKKVIGWKPGKHENFEIEHWPSVSYIAAVPWLAHVWKFAEIHGLPNACAGYKEIVDDHTKSGIFGETAAEILNLPKFSNRFFDLDGHFYHLDAIRSMDLDRFKGKDHAERKTHRDAVEKALLVLHKEVKTAFTEKKTTTVSAAQSSSPPLVASEFYAVLIADGDNIGKNLRTQAGEDAAKTGLAKFTQAVPGIIKSEMGVTNYAGGDDVLAVLPLDTAIDAAIRLRVAYAESFSSDPDWTLSAAIVFAQYKIPFRAVLREAHNQLDKIAKEKNGRDSCAIAVLKPGGVAFSWVSAWSQTAIPAYPASTRDPALDTAARATWRNASVPGTLLAMARELQAEREFATGFLYNIRERYAPLFEDGSSFRTDPHLKAQFKRFLLAEYLKGGEQRDTLRTLAEERMDKLMSIGFPLERTSGTPEPAKAFEFDAGLVMRFLAEEGRWFME